MGYFCLNQVFFHIFMSSKESASSRPNRSKICVIPDRIGLKSVHICEICGKKGKAAKKSSKEKICVICEICVTKKSPDYFRNRGFDKRRRLPTLPHCIAVPSAQVSLTSLFGMGRGGTSPQ